MKHLFIAALGGLFLSILSTPALSQDESAEAACDPAVEDCPGKWDGNVEFGYVAFSGNQETTSLNGRFFLGWEKNKWRHQGFIASVTSSSEETDSTGNLVETDSEKYTAQLKSDYKFGKKSYAFGILDYDKTKDSGFEYQASIALGLGYAFIDSEKHILDGELGLGSRRSETEATLTDPSMTNTESLGRIAGIYKWKISESSEFEQKLSSDIGEDNTISKSYTALSANIWESLGMKFSYAYKHQSEVPLGNKKKETITAFTLVYTF